MREIRGLTRDIVTKVKGFGEKPIEGEFATLDVKCPKCSEGPFKEDYRTYTCANCALRIWKSMAGREFEPEEVRALLTDLRVGPLNGFVSKMGRQFSAVVTLDPKNDFKPTFEFESDLAARAEEQADLSQLTPIAPCPVCKKGSVFELEKTYACENALHPSPGKDCDLRIGKVILQKQIPPEQMRKLLVEGRTDLLNGFISKKGKARAFSAHLTLNNKGKIGWEFPPRAEKRGGKPPAAKAA